MSDSQKRRLRWRLVLGETTENTLGSLPEEWHDSVKPTLRERETAIGFLDRLRITRAKYSQWRE